MLSVALTILGLPDCCSKIFGHSASCPGLPKNFLALLTVAQGCPTAASTHLFCTWTICRQLPFKWQLHLQPDVPITYRLGNCKHRELPTSTSYLLAHNLFTTIVDLFSTTTLPTTISLLSIVDSTPDCLCVVPTARLVFSTIISLSHKFPSRSGSFYATDFSAAITTVHTWTLFTSALSILNSTATYNSSPITAPNSLQPQQLARSVATISVVSSARFLCST